MLVLLLQLLIWVVVVVWPWVGTLVFMLTSCKHAYAWTTRLCQWLKQTLEHGRENQLSLLLAPPPTPLNRCCWAPPPRTPPPPPSPVTGRWLRQASVTVILSRCWASQGSAGAPATTAWTVLRETSSACAETCAASGSATQQQQQQQEGHIRSNNMR
jgi:hypothetical protein